MACNSAGAFALVIVVGCVGFCRGHFSIKLTMSKEVANEKDDVIVTCDVNNSQPNTNFTLVWLKRVGDKEFVISSNSHVEDRFRQTGRYRASYDVIRGSANVKYTLNINDAKLADTGDIGCRIPNHGIDVFKHLSVSAPILSVRLLTRSVDDSHVHSYADGRRLTFVEGEIRRVMCRVNGTHPSPVVKMFVGDRDITDQFTTTTKASFVQSTAPDNPHQATYYQTELYSSELRMGFDFSGKSMRCVASVKGSNANTSTSIVITFAAYKPKFIGCVSPVVTKPVYATNVPLDCVVQAQPPVTNAWIRWTRGSERTNVTLEAGRRDGHYHLTLKPHNDTDAMKTIAFMIDKVYPQHFRTYTFVAQNSEDKAEFEFQLVKAKEKVETSDTSSRSYNKLLATALLLLLAIVFT